MKKQERNKILTLFLPAVLICFLVLIYAPIEIYSANIDGFTYDIYDLLVMMFAAFIPVSLFAYGVCAFLCKKSKKKYLYLSALCMSAFFVLYILGNFFSNNLPPLDGSIVDWSRYDGQRIISVIVCVISVSFVFALLLILKKEKYERLIKYVCFFFGAMLLLSGILTVISGDTSRKKEDFVITSDGITEMSSDTNFIILLLDSISADSFQAAMDSSPEYEETLEGFTFFRNTVGAYPFTEQTIPFLFSGDWYENDESYYSYKIKAYENSPLFASLRDADYKMSLYEQDLPASSECLEIFDNALHTDTFRFHVPLKFITTQIQLAGFKYFPYDLKRFCVVAPDYLYANSQKRLSTGSYFSWDNSLFYDKVNHEETETVSDKCFKFIHLRGAHQPFMLEPDMQYNANGTSYEDCVLASLKLTDAYLQKLKDADVYDNSVIIIMADHGYYEDVRQNPMLLVKGRGEHHDFKTSDAPLSFEDLISACQKLLYGSISEDAFPWKEGDIRERRFLKYLYYSEDEMHEYLQTGPANSFDTMLPTGNVFIRQGEYIKEYSIEESN